MVETEFNFWVPSNMLCHRERSNHVGPDDTFPLLCSSRGSGGDLSPATRLRRIEEGRKELMEMIRDVPESCYELSLKDIVVGLRPGVGGSPIRPEVSGAVVNDKQGKKKKKRRRVVTDTSARPGLVTRTSSMEAGPFLIRMFLPTFLMPNRTQPASGNRSKSPLSSSPRVSLDWSDGRAVGRWPLTRDDERRSSHEGTSRSKSCTSRIEHDNGGSGGLMFGCWPFGGMNNSSGKAMKGKMIRQKTCNF